MTREERIAKMAEIKTNIEAKIAQYNDLMLDDKSAEATAVFNEADKAVDEYNGHCRFIAFEDCRDSDDPMIEACRRLTYKAIRIKELPIEGRTIKKKEVDETYKVIDLVKLNKFCVDSGKPKIGADPDWVYAAHKMNYLMTLDRAVALGISKEVVSSDYRIGDVAKALKKKDDGKEFSVSNTQMLKTLTYVIQQMIGTEYKPTSHDVKYLEFIYSKKGKGALKVACAKHGLFISYLQEICYRLINDLHYGVEYQVKK